VNITGGNDLTLGEVHQVNEIVHDAVGDDAEIIFGAVNEPAMQGEIRVTVIATGFDRSMDLGHSGRNIENAGASRNATVIPFSRSARPSSNGPARVLPAADSPRRPSSPAPGERAGQDLTDMEIPTFIRRQMD
jgi:cell division protein FtsZ